MMKKLLVLALVLGIAGMATATLNISVNGDKAYVDGSLVVPAGTVVDLGIFTDTGISSAGDYVMPNFALVVQLAEGTIAGGAALGTYANVAIYDGAASVEFVGMAPGMDGVWGDVTVWSNEASLVPGTDMFGGIQFTIANTALVQLYRIDDTWAVAELMDSALIVTPEPMTMLLLGLGGLFLRKK